MWLVRWIRLFFGTVSFKGQGGFLSRFVNLCHQKRIPLWDLEINGSELSAQTSVNGYKRLRQSARKSGVRVHAVEKSGIPFLLHKNRARIGLVAGLFLSVALYAVCSQCLWRIEVNGNRTVRAEAILAAAQASGVSRGAWKHNVDVSAAEIAVRRSIPEISWVAVNLRGSTAVIEVREQVEAPPIVEQDTPTHLVAARDGYVEQLHIERGTALVKNKEAVEKGEVLISGIVTKKDETTYVVHAQGSCVARTQRELRITPDLSEYAVIGSVYKQNSLYFFGVEIPVALAKKQSFSSVTEIDVSLSEVLLPIGARKNVSYELTALNDSFLAKDEYFLLSCSSFYEAYAAMMEECEMLDEQLREEQPGTGTLFWRADCRENIAIEVPIEEYLADSTHKE